MRATLLVLVAVAVAASYPRAREAMAEAARPALAPVFRWQTLWEMNRIAREVQLYERENIGRLPDTGRFSTWVAATFSEAGAMDAWGNPYVLVQQRDSFSVVSWGADGIPRTDADLRVARPRAHTIR